MKLKVFSQDGAEKGTAELSDELFGGEVNRGLLHLVISMYRANRRQGTSKTKGRSEVSGGGKKPYRQKGTGRARAGSNTSPVWKRGGTAHGPSPRLYRSTIPGKMRKTALRHALSSRVQAEKIVVVDNVTMKEVKTREIASLIGALSLNGSRILLRTDGINRDIYLSGRNIRDLQVMPLESLNAYEVLRYDNIVLAGTELVEKLHEVVSL
jgi:large subunit ribosomal protein L4